MTVATLDCVVEGAVVAIDVAIPLDWPVHAAGEVVVTCSDGTVAILNTDYLVVLNPPDYDKAYIVPKAGLFTKADGYPVTIERDTAALQTLAIPVNSRLPEKEIEKQLDRAVMRDQETKRRIDADRGRLADIEERGLFVPEGELGFELPPLASRAGKIPIFSASDGVAPGLLSPTGVDIGVPGFESVVASTIAPNAVTTVKINAAAVTTAKIADAAVTPAKVASNSFMLTFATRAAMAAYTPRAQSVAFVYDEGGFNGLFFFTAGNQSAKVTADPVEGVWVAPDASPTGSTGAWQRYVEGGFKASWFGATAAATDNWGAIQAAINYANSLAGGTVVIDGGYKTAQELFLTTPLVRIAGLGSRWASIYTTTPNHNVIKFAAARCQVNNLSVFSYIRSTVASAPIAFVNGAVQCTVDDCDVVGGFYSIAVVGTGATDNHINNSVFRAAIGGAVCYIQGGGAIFFDRCLFNQDWPVTTPAVNGSQDGGNWASGQSYATGVFVRTGGFILQSISSPGVTAGVAPTLTGKYYGDVITDGGVTWYIANNSAAVAVLIDTASTYIRFEGCDFTGSFFNAAQVVNNFGGNAPDVISFEKCTAAGLVGNAFNVLAARRISICECEMQVCVGAFTDEGGIYTGSGFNGEATFDNNLIAGGYSIGIRLGNTGGGHVSATGNKCFCTIGLYVEANVTKFDFYFNDCGASAIFGACTQAITVAVGTSNDYNIVYNKTKGATTGVSDGGTGVTKNVSANNT